jgi:raffinose/stachyose/melibiose transport system permease protein
MRTHRGWRITLAMVIPVAVMALPFYYVIVNTLKTQPEAVSSPLSLPLHPYFSNYSHVLSESGLGQALFNTAYVTVISVGLMVLIGSLAAFGVLVAPPKVSLLAGMALLIAFLVPTQATLIPIYQTLVSAHLVDNLNGLIVVYSCGAIFCYYLIVGYMRTLPTELFEAARIDGAGNWRMFRSIVVPLCRPILITVSVFQTMWVWNDFIIPNVFISTPSKQTLVLRVYSSVSQFVTDWPSFMTLSVLVLLPMVLFFIIMQRHIISGLTQGSVKG